MKFNSSIFTALAVGALVVTLSTPAVTAKTTDNFVLIDHNGHAQQLYYHSDAGAVLIISQQNSCAAQSAQLASYKLLNETYQDKNVKTYLLNSEDSREAISNRADLQALNIPILHDSAQIIGASLELANAGEALVIDPKTWEVIYRGPASHPDLKSTLDNLLSGEAVSNQQLAVENCDINYNHTAKVPDYGTAVVPILRENCMACHVEGGIGPWAMTEYNMILGFSPMIREVIRVKRMPPWHADPAVGHWQNNAGISDAETRTLIDWIEAGAPRGEGEDPLLAARETAPTWPLGEPDLILDIPPFDVPATGVVEYQFPVVANPLDRDVWVMAATVLPGDTTVVHHVLMGSAEKAPEKEDRESVFQNYIMGYAPGNESAYMPEGTGVFVPVGGVYQFQLHYTPTGIATRDATRVGLYFADKPPANFLRQQVVLNPRIRIPAETEAHEESAYFEFWDDATIYALVPHSHYRGKSSTFELAYPDGQTELILSVPNYDFNWQRTYSFTEPKEVPKGTRIIHRTVYDNSIKNPGNPDPAKEVRWGLQSHNEMLYGSVAYSWKNERSDAPIHSNASSDTAQFIGFMDKDMDGKLSKEELPRRMRERLNWWKWWFVDTNFDGGLDLAEVKAMFNRDS